MTNGFQGKKVLILGTGVSGNGAFEALVSLGAACVMHDDKSAIHPDISGFDRVVISPAIPLSHWSYKEAARAGVEIIGEIELGAQIYNGDIIAVTGTNGKTTTTELIGNIFARAKISTSVCGNIGVSFSKCAAFDNSAAAIVEVSSFQLESIISFKPHIAVILNISPDHLERHGTIEEYITAKLRIAKNQTKDDYLILSQDDIPVSALLGFRPESGVFYTSTCGKVRGAYVLDNEIYFCGERICDVRAVKLHGVHNLSNALAAVCAARLYGIDRAVIAETLSEFDSGEHRIKFVANVNGKSYYNDSKGTNIDATIKAADSMDGDTLLILGGSDKGYEFDELFEKLANSVKHIFTLGQTAPKILAAAFRTGFVDIEKVESLSEAVMRSKDINVKNVLLSPACASFDMFKDYKDRGEQFINFVKGLSVP